VPFICLAAYLIVGIRDGKSAGTLLSQGTSQILSPTKQRIAFVVDSEFGSHRDINDREDSAILQQWEETFSETGTVDYSAAGGTVGSYRDLAKWMRDDESTKGSMSGFSNWQHMLSLPLVSIAGDTAHARTDFFATHRGRADQGWNVHYNATGAFHDDVVRHSKAGAFNSGGSRSTLEIPWRLPRPPDWWCLHLYSRSDGRLLGQNLFCRPMSG
jgi:SnoaL-like domain